MATELKTVSGTWTCPSNVYEIEIECWGAGSGEYSRRKLVVTPNQTYSFVVGIAGYTNGANTGDTYWVDTSTVFAKGGWDSLEPGLIKITYQPIEINSLEVQSSSKNIVRISNTSVISAEQEAMVDYLIANVPGMTSSVTFPYNPATHAGDVTTAKADFLLTWQMDGSGTGVDGTKGSPDHNGIGGWSKDFDDRIYSRNWDGSEQITKSWRSGTATNENGTSTLDNDGTTEPIHYLAAVYGLYGGATYQDAAWKAIQMIFAMQHLNGSFMESYPPMLESASSQYPNQCVINDDTHRNVMQMYRKILNGVYPFDNDFFSTAQKAEIQTSYNLALDFLIQSQIKQTATGKREIWAGNYTAETYTPGWHRHMEPPGKMDAESALLTYMLIGHTPQTPETKRAIYYSALWCYENALVDTGYRNNLEPYFYTLAGSIYWHRFTELDSNNVPIYGDDYVLYYNLSDISSTTRTTYSWATTNYRKLYDATKTYIDANGIPAEPIEETTISLICRANTNTRTLIDLTVPERIIEIERQMNSGNWEPLIILFDVDPLTYLDTDNLQSGNNYCYRIRKWSNGIATEWSNIDCVNYNTSGLPIEIILKTSTNSRSSAIIETGKAALVLNTSTNNRSSGIINTGKTLLNLKTQTNNRATLDVTINTSIPTGIISAEQEAMVDYLIANVSSSWRAQSFSPPATVSTTNANYLLTWQMDGSGTGTWGTKGSPDHNGIGGWSKDFDDRIYSRNWNGSEQITKSWRSGTMTNENGTSTLDNDGTVRPIQFLAAVYGQYGGSAYQAAGWKAIQMILTMQHNNGSFMESYPTMLPTASSQYPNQGLINDEVHYNVMQMFRKILNGTYPFNNTFFSTAQKAEIQTSYDKGIDFLVQSQIKRTATGKREVWCGNYTAETYTPGWNRDFEPPSNMSIESLMLLYMLLDHTPMTPEIKRMIYYGALWFYENVLTDTAYRNSSAPYFYYSAGSTTWYRFYEFETGTGIFAEDWAVYYDLGQLSVERRTGYTWGYTSSVPLYNTTKTYIDANGIPAEPTPETTISLKGKTTTNTRAILNLSISSILLTLQTKTNNRTYLNLIELKALLSLLSNTENRTELKIFETPISSDISRKDGFDKKKFDRVFLPSIAQSVDLRSLTNNRSTISLHVLENNYMIFVTQSQTRSSALIEVNFNINLKSVTSSRAKISISGEELVYNYILKVRINNTTYSIPIYSLAQVGLNNNSVRIYYNNQVYVFDAVPTSHISASPIRVMTKDGILSLKQIT